MRKKWKFFLVFFIASIIVSILTRNISGALNLKGDSAQIIGGTLGPALLLFIVPCLIFIVMIFKRNSVVSTKLLIRYTIIWSILTFLLFLGSNAEKRDKITLARPEYKKDNIKSENTIDEGIMNFVKEINKSCPIAINNYTQLDNTMAALGKSIQYNYKINYNKKDIDVNKFKEDAMPLLINYIKTSDPMKYLRENNVTFIYNYKDKKYIFLFSLTVTPDMYK
jgi:hypothetical protein